MNPLVASVIRTIVPAAVGQIGAWLALLNVPLTTDARVGLTAFLGFAFNAIYYVLVRVVEQQWPSVGVLLGLPKSPDTYSKSVDTAAVPVPSTVTYNATGIPGAAFTLAGPATIDATPAVVTVDAPEITAPEVTPTVTPAQ